MRLQALEFPFMNTITRLVLVILTAGVTGLLAVAHGVDQLGARAATSSSTASARPSLVARYQLQNNAEDSSRNQFHAALRGTGRFRRRSRCSRRALLLTGDGSHVQLPANTLDGEDTISVTGWLFLPTGASGPVFDFGRDAANRLFATASRDGLRASVVLNGMPSSERRPPAPSPKTSGCTLPSSSIRPRARCPRTSTARRHAQAADVSVDGDADRAERRRRRSTVPRPFAGRRRADAARAAA